MRRETAHPLHRRRGFTLAEILIVIGIIALLIGILIPAISMVTRSGRRTVTSATLASISSALENYHADFDDYPRFTAGPVPTADETGGALNDDYDRGARLLARVLIGPAPQTDPNVGDVTDYSTVQEYQDACVDAFQDGHGTPDQPFGWKERRQIITRGGASGVVFPGEVKGPYLDADKFNVRRSGTGFGHDAVLLDNNDMPILYYPARRKQPNINAAPGTGGPFDPVGLVADQGYEFAPGVLYNAFDNRGDSAGDFPGLSAVDAADDPDRLSLAEMLGDRNQNGFIDNGETAATTGPYLLIASGTDPFRFDPDRGTWYAVTPVANFDVQGQ